MTAAGARYHGFTLVELVVVLFVMGLAMAMVAPSVTTRVYEAMQYHATVRAILADMKSARLAAARSGQPAVFALDLASRRFGVGGQLGTPLPDGLLVRAVVAEKEISPSGQAAIRFYPEGGATGGSIDLVRPSGAGVRLRVDWLLGRVVQETPDPS